MKEVKERRNRESIERRRRNEDYCRWVERNGKGKERFGGMREGGKREEEARRGMRERKEGKKKERKEGRNRKDGYSTMREGG